MMKAERNKSAAVIMDVLRRSRRVSRVERIRNERIKDIMKIKRIILHDRQKTQQILYSHVKRMSDKRLPKIILNYKIN